MIGKTACALGAIALLAGCNAEPSGNDTNSVVPSAETRNAAAAAPLSKDQALALMKERQDHMKALGKATKTVHTALEASTPDAAPIRESAATIAELAPKLESWFPAGTGPDVGKTRAKAEIWQKPEDFAINAQDFNTAADDFKYAAMSGELGRINSTFDALGKSCKACHDLYRAPEKH